LSNPFLDQAFRTLSYRIQVTVNANGTWSYEEEGKLQIPRNDELFRHIDRNTLTLIAPPTLNPLARATRGGVVRDSPELRRSWMRAARQPAAAKPVRHRQPPPFSVTSRGWNAEGFDECARDG
jgi:hypothetical protein